MTSGARGHGIGVFEVDEEVESLKDNQVDPPHFALVVDSQGALVQMYRHPTDQGVEIEALARQGTPTAQSQVGELQ